MKHHIQQKIYRKRSLSTAGFKFNSRSSCSDKLQIHLQKTDLCDLMSFGVNVHVCVLSPLAVAVCRGSWRWRAASAGPAWPCFSAGWGCSFHWSPAGSLGGEEDAGTYSSPWNSGPVGVRQEEEETRRAKEREREGWGGQRHGKGRIRIVLQWTVA